MKRIFLLVIWLVLSICPWGFSRTEENDKYLYIGGIFPISGTVGWQGGQACEPAAAMALEDINRNGNYLNGYKLKLDWNDSLCEPGIGAAVFYDLIYKDPKKLMLIGGCSTVSTTIAEVARLWNLVVVSFGSSSPALSDRTRFPTFFRTHPSATVHNPTRVRLMKKFGWSRIAIIQQTEEVFISTVEDLEIECKQKNIEIVTRQSFLNDPTDAVRNLRRQDARIIIGLFYVVAARRVLCEIYKNQLYGKAYVWFFIGWYEDNWYLRNLKEENLNCTAQQMREAAEGHITTEALMWNQDNQKTISGMTADDFEARLKKELTRRKYDIANNRYPEGYQEAPLAYDAIWSIALALNRTMAALKKMNKSIDDFSYTNTIIAHEIFSAMNATEFLGISGRVAFSTDGSRIAWTQIEQMIDGKYQKLGYYDFQSGNLSWLGQEQWLGGKVPQDRTIIRPSLRTISLPLFIGMSTICFFGIIWTLFLLGFNFTYRKRRFIQLSHPACNNTCLIGIILCLSAVFLLGLDGQFIPEDYFHVVCGARAWVLSIGFSLAYGAMFSKVWRAHRLTTKANVDLKQRVEPWKLYAMVSCFVIIDVAILICWQLLDPLHRKLEEFPLEIPLNTTEDIKIKPILEHCGSEHDRIWLGITYSYKGLLLIFGLFLSYETRSIKIRQINDSRWIGMSIYNVAVLCLITAPVTLIIPSQQNASFGFVALAVIFCCFLSQALVFVPKMIEIKNHPRERLDSSDVVLSREDEEKYQKILKENQEIQRLIAEKEEKIRALRRKKAERDSINENSSSAFANLDSTKRQTRPSVRIITPSSAQDSTSEQQNTVILCNVTDSYL